LKDNAAKAKTKIRAKLLLDGLSAELQGCDWHSPTWLDEVMGKIGIEFEGACERWRSLYRAAVGQRDAQNRIIGDASRAEQDRDQARRLRAEAETQIELLLKSDSRFQADFYSYRYFASEGFLPGYNFPRLPLSAFVPGQRGAKGRDEYISRPRFLAVSEFGPGSFLYHEGSRYVISRVMVAVQEDEELASGKVKQCEACGYMHPISEGDGPDICEMCKRRLPHAMNNLFRMRNVSTRRRDRINSDEEERTKYGYTLRTGFRFASHGSVSAYRMAEALGDNGQSLATLKYGHGATLWRINLGWANRAKHSPPGFMLDFNRGMWTKEGGGGADDELNDPGMGRIRRVIPYVEDRKNCLVFMPNSQLSPDAMVSLQSSLKQAVQQAYQLEDFEIASETLPAGGQPQALLLYESAEGGAGVLRRLVDDPQSLGKVAAEALRLCHFDPATGADRKKADHAEENCVVACYDCLMNYSNQRIHTKLNRHSIRDYLLALTRGSVSSAPSAMSRQDHLKSLLNRCESSLERAWLEHLEKRGHTLPSHAQYVIRSCKTRPDFYYANVNVAVYIDGPWHEFPERQERDQAQREHMENLGITVLRFAAGEQWQPLLDEYPHIFGRRQ
jgi:very-short-patch-repair endonuclease